jgi:hypothetical protein
LARKKKPKNANIATITTVKIFWARFILLIYQIAGA